MDDVPEGGMKGVTVDGKRILVARVQGDFYAIDAVCSHLAGNLAQGTLENAIVTCPRHHSQYDIRTGKVVKNVSRLVKLATRKEATGQRSYETRVLGSDILLKRPL